MRVRLELANDLENFEAVRTRRHHQIRENDVELLSRLAHTDGFGATFGRAHTEATSFEIFAECQAQVTIVVDDEDPCFRCK